MNYEFKHQNYSNFEIFEDNKLKGRSYFIAFKDKARLLATDYLSERANSDMVTMLSGEWDFSYFPKVSDLPKNIDTKDFQFNKVGVPSCWQFTGYEEPYYVNQEYQFPPNPPKFPTDCSVAVYKKNISIKKISKNEIITFLGVCACLELYCNGVYVGYSEGSHNSSEFNITDFLNDGENEIVCLVYKFCNGTYLECQDMFRSNGIFRDVYITHFNESFIYDISVTTKKIDNNSYSVSLLTKTMGKATELQYTIMQGNNLISVQSACCDCEVVVDIKNALEWSAEIPNLYTLYIEYYNDGKLIECVRKEFGCRKIEIAGNVFNFNDKKIKLRGVNHHDSNESTGYYMTNADIVKDITLMKQFNVNAVRTSHYPPDPTFLIACDHFGLYVVDEADIETHGVCVGLYRPNLISNNLNWKIHYWDRVKRMYERDKNSPCVIMWSLGNESGGYMCQDFCYNELKKITSTPIHYEGVIRTVRWNYDVTSQMYSDTLLLEKIATGKMPEKYTNKPFFLCEFAHAMGVGAGELDKYVDLFYQYDGFMGGCIWEWCDHAVKHVNDKYKFEYTYGGDHGEKVHSSNFCVDGLFYPNRTPHTGAYSMKNIYRPLRVKNVDTNKFEFTSYNSFLDTSYIGIQWQLLVKGIVVDNGNIKDLVIKPLETSIVKIAHQAVNLDSDTFMTFTYTNKLDGSLIAVEQIILSEHIDSLPITRGGIDEIISNNQIGFKFENGAILFNKESGALQSYTHKGIEYVNNQPARADGICGFVPTLYRAAIDNYMYVNKIWKKQGLHDIKIKVKSVNTEKAEGKISVTYQLLLNNKPAFLSEVSYQIYATGAVDISCSLLTNKVFKKFDLPKFGLTFEMNSSFNNIKYYGYGDKECYSDFNKQSTIGIYKTKVEKMLEPYIKPQDSGNRMGVRFATITNEDGGGLTFKAIEKAFNFNATNITLDNLSSAKHREDLIKQNTTSVCIDSFIRGVGSNSCGQDAKAQFRLILKKGMKLQYAFRLEPVTLK